MSTKVKLYFRKEKKSAYASVVCRLLLVVVIRYRCDAAALVMVVVAVRRLLHRIEVFHIIIIIKMLHGDCVARP